MFRIPALLVNETANFVSSGTLTQTAEGVLIEARMAGDILVETFLPL